jgi:hypothetical protein
MDEGLRRRLLALAAEDARVRIELARDGSLFGGYHPRMAAVHAANAQVLESALAEGWPGFSRVGEDGAEAAWLIAQHAIGLPAFQRHCLALLAAAVAQGDVPATHLAYLTDRVSTLEGCRQVYGTQFDWDEEGQMSPLAIDDEAHVDARRAAAGLPPLAETIARQRSDAAHSGEHAPEDRARHAREFEAWRRKAGWC